jgi:hypothetical protein
MEQHWERETAQNIHLTINATRAIGPKGETKDLSIHNSKGELLDNVEVITYLCRFCNASDLQKIFKPVILSNDPDS